MYEESTPRTSRRLFWIYLNPAVAILALVLYCLPFISRDLSLYPFFPPAFFPLALAYFIGYLVSLPCILLCWGGAIIQVVLALRPSVLFSPASQHNALATALVVIQAQLFDIVLDNGYCFTA